MRRVFFLSILFVVALTGCQKQLVPHSAIASAHPLATAAGMDILVQGGNAFDAAVAVSATLAVVEPYSSGLGGGGFYLLHRQSDGRQIMLDAREVAPSQASATMYLDDKGEVIPQRSTDGPLAAGIPGVPAALAKLAKDYGKLPLTQTLAPAMRIARDGFAVTPQYQAMAKFRLEALRASPAARAIFLVNNDVPPVGSKILQTDLANTLQQLADKGAAGFYQGDTAAQLLKGVQAGGGIWKSADLQNYSVKDRLPIVFNYRGYRIVSAPPPSSGGIALAEMFNMLSGFERHPLDAVKRTHLLIEVMRRAYRDRAEFLGDPDFVKVPQEKLVSIPYAEDTAGTISFEHATPNSILPPVVAPPPQGNHTTHFSIIDTAGNRVAATLSINLPFGCAFVAPGTGVLLNNEMDDFVAKAGVPNAYGLIGAQANSIAPNKRMLSSMTPTFVESNDKVAILGTPGGSRIITMVLAGVLGVIDNKTAAQIVSQPRFHHQYLPDVVHYEQGAFDTEQLAQLQHLGHSVQQVENPYGNLQIIIWDKTKKEVSAASDPRGEGQASVK
jgi:gamma-glutamyltranspeptidase / glutathione hydrolase